MVLFDISGSIFLFHSSGFLFFFSQIYDLVWVCPQWQLLRQFSSFSHSSPLEWRREVSVGTNASCPSKQYKGASIPCAATFSIIFHTNSFPNDDDLAAALTSRSSRILPLTILECDCLRRHHQRVMLLAMKAHMIISCCRDLEMALRVRPCDIRIQRMITRSLQILKPKLWLQ